MKLRFDTPTAKVLAEISYRLRATDSAMMYWTSLEMEAGPVSDKMKVVGFLDQGCLPNYAQIGLATALKVGYHVVLWTHNRTLTGIPAADKWRIFIVPRVSGEVLAQRGARMNAKKSVSPWSPKV